MNYLKLIVGIFISLGILLYFRWIGLKGLLGFASGVLITLYLLLSKNPMLKMFIDMTDSNTYIDELIRNDKNKKP